MILIIFHIISCDQDCNKYRDLFIENECNVILSKDYTDNQPEFMIVKGINPNTKEKCKCQDNVKNWYFYNGYMEKGDTLVKRKGDDFYKIHKKDTIFIIYYGECNNYNQYVRINNNPPKTN
ncbi:MAG TPA: hypothetical protein VL022_02020 [Moheibacter sp.]|nr:hypothetical protein [Moheibacter sp.]